VRRLIDVLSAAGGLAVLSPLLAALAVWIKLDSRGPVFYRARRAGRGGAPFRLYKFRSMTVGADQSGPAITSAGDRRVTQAGRFLRGTKLDELPQLINVLRGEMSLIGPRPEDLRYVDLYTVEQRGILAYRPGITSPASLAFRHEEQLLQGPDWESLYRTQVMPIKIAIDLAYMESRSLRSDLRVVTATLKAL
jgi:lipopolysaccharide/colanic/teichoic acid biosynthesis glycosyltransferase